MKMPGKLWQFFLNPSLEQKRVKKVDLNSVAKFFILSYWGFGWKEDRREKEGRKEEKEEGRKEKTLS